MAIGIIGALVFLACIMLFIYSLIKGKTKKWWGIGIILGFVLFIVGIATSGEPANVEAPVGTQQTVTTEQQLENIVAKELGTCNREGVEKISAIDIVNAGYGYNLDIHYAIDDNLSGSWIIDGAWMEICDTMEALYTSGIDIQWVDMYGSFSMVDKYGNAEEKEVMHVRLGRDTAAKVSWENMPGDMLMNILDFKDIHPAFQ